jgi:hypothetical protein
VCVLAYAYAAAVVFELPAALIWGAEILGWLLSWGLSDAWLNGRWAKNPLQHAGHFSEPP